MDFTDMEYSKLPVCPENLDDNENQASDQQGEPGHEHDHAHVHGHGHVHSHQQTQVVLNRLSRAIGHLESVKRMVEDGRDCTEVLIQLAAVRSALNNTAKIILKDHIEHCITGAEGDSQALEELNAAIDKFI